jgi:poly(3-hydroxyalkanoate) synthetase
VTVTWLAGGHVSSALLRQKINDLVGSRDRKAFNFSAGHIGLSVGSKAQKEVWPQAVKWLGERSEAL